MVNHSNEAWTWTLSDRKLEQTGVAGMRTQKGKQNWPERKGNTEINEKLMIII
jgi:hypothetical protein